MLYRFCRAVCGVYASPFLLNATLKHHISQYQAHPEFVENLSNSFYVDDLVTREQNLERCLFLYQKSKKCLSEGGFNLWKWISNSPKLLELICEDQAGVEDTCAVGLQPTRRNLLKVTSSFFDPLGLISPILVEMKVLSQVLCKRSLTGMHRCQSEPRDSSTDGFRTCERSSGYWCHGLIILAWKKRLPPILFMGLGTPQKGFLCCGVLGPSSK